MKLIVNIKEQLEKALAKAEVGDILACKDSEGRTSFCTIISPDKKYYYPCSADGTLLSLEDYNGFSSVGLKRDYAEVKLIGENPTLKKIKVAELSILRSSDKEMDEYLISMGNFHQVFKSEANKEMIEKYDYLEHFNFKAELREMMRAFLDHLLLGKNAKEFSFATDIDQQMKDDKEEIKREEEKNKNLYTLKISALDKSLRASYFLELSPRDGNIENTRNLSLIVKIKLENEYYKKNKEIHPLRQYIQTKIKEEFGIGILGQLTVGGEETRAKEGVKNLIFRFEISIPIKEQVSLYALGLAEFNKRYGGIIPLPSKEEQATNVKSYLSAKAEVDAKIQQLQKEIMGSNEEQRKLYMENKIKPKWLEFILPYRQMGYRFSFI